MTQFDFVGARKAGYGDDEIAEGLAARLNFDFAGARSAGYSSTEIIDGLMARMRPPVDTATENTDARDRMTGPGALEVRNAERAGPAYRMGGGRHSEATRLKIEDRDLDRRLKQLGYGIVPATIEKKREIVARGERAGPPPTGREQIEAQAGMSIRPGAEDAVAEQLRSRGIKPADPTVTGTVDAFEPRLADQASEAVARGTRDLGVPGIASLTGGAAREYVDTVASVSRAIPQTAALISDVGQFLTAGHVGADASRVLRAVDDRLGSMQSGEHAGKASQLADIIDSGDPAAAVAFLLLNPKFAIDTAIPSMGTMAPGVGAASLSAKLAALPRAVRALPAAEIAAIRSGAATAGATGANVLMNVGDTYAQTGSYEATIPAAVATLLAGKLTRGGAEAALARGRGGMLSTGLVEGPQELIESLGQQVGEQTARGAFDPGKAFSQAAVEGTLGTLSGVGAGAVTAREVRADAALAHEGRLRFGENSAIMNSPTADAAIDAAAAALARPNVAAAELDRQRRERVAQVIAAQREAAPDADRIQQATDDELLARIERQIPAAGAVPREAISSTEGIGTAAGNLTAAPSQEGPEPAAVPTWTGTPSSMGGQPIRVTPQVGGAPAPVGPSAIDMAAKEAATSPANDRPEPTDAQKSAGNYKVGKVTVNGLPISIENEAGTSRRPEWPPLKDHYGYIRRTEGADGDHVDVFVKPGTSHEYAGPVFVVDQIDPKTGRFDEHKVLIGPAQRGDAEMLYRRNYDKNWQGLGAITEFTWPQFRDWLANGDTTKPLAYTQPKGAADAGSMSPGSRTPTLQSGRLEATPDGINAAIQALGDLAGRQAVVEHGFHGLPRDRQQSVLSGVIAQIRDEKIGRAIVESIPINVMHNLIGRELSAEQILDDRSVLVDRLSVPADKPVPPAVALVIDQLASLVPSNTTSKRASVAAKLGSPGRTSKDLRATLVARDENLSGTPGGSANLRAKDGFVSGDIARIATNADTARSATDGDHERIVQRDQETGRGTRDAQPRREEAPRVGAPTRILGSVGLMPRQATPVELRPNADGTVTPFAEGREMLDFESGEPIRLPAGLTDAAARDAIRAAGALSRGMKFFTVKEAALAAKQRKQAQPNADQRPAASVSESQLPAPSGQSDRGVTPTQVRQAAADQVADSGKPTQAPTAPQRSKQDIVRAKNRAAKRRAELRRRENETAEEFGQRRRKQLIVELKNAGGLSINDSADITGESRKRSVQMMPGLFRKTGMRIDMAIEKLVGLDYLPADAIGKEMEYQNEAFAVLRKIVQQESVYRQSDTDRVAELEMVARMADRAGMDTETAAAALDLMPDDLTPAEVDAAFDAVGYLTDQGIASEDAVEKIVERAALRADSGVPYEQAVREEADAYRAGTSRGSDARREGDSRSQAQGEAEGSALELTEETPAEVRAREARAERQRQDEARREAAPPAEDFTLAGSDRAVDQAEARGQMQLGDAGPAITARGESRLGGGLREQDAGAARGTEPAQIESAATSRAKDTGETSGDAIAGLSKNSNAWKDYSAETAQFRDFASDNSVEFVRSNSRRTGWFVRGGERLREVGRDVSERAATKAEAITLLRAAAIDRANRAAVDLAHARALREMAAEKNAKIKANLGILTKAMTEDAEAIANAHKNENLTFAPLLADAFLRKDTIAIYQSPSYGGKPGSSYRLVLVDGQPAYARMSDHWGKFSSRSNEDPDVWNEHDWQLEGNPPSDGKRRAGYVFLDDLPTDSPQSTPPNQRQAETKPAAGEALESRDASVAPTWFSALARAVEGINAKAIGAGDWTVRLRALVGKQDVKADELEWTGVLDWLGMQQGRVTKDAVLAYLREQIMGGMPLFSMDSRVLPGFRSYQGKADPDQALTDALGELAALGVDIGDVEIVREHRADAKQSPMRIFTGKRTIHYNTAADHSRAGDVEGALEELLHIIDNVAGDNLLSTGSQRLSSGGDLRTEIEAAVLSGDSTQFRDWLKYPLDRKRHPDLSSDRVTAELFARVGVFYAVHPSVLARVAPKTKEAYDRIFKPRSGGVQGEARTVPDTGTDRAVERTGSLLRELQPGRAADHVGRARPDDAGTRGQRGSGNSSELDAVRRRIAETLGSDPAGKRFGQHDLETRSAPGLPEETRLQAFERYIADNLNRVRDVQGAIRERGGRAEEFGPRDVYRAAERFPGIVTDRLDTFTRAEVEPLLRGLDESGITPDELALYAYAKHAPERNAHIARINPQFGESDLAGERPGSGMSDTDAAAIVETAEAEHPQIADFHRRLLAITAGTRQMLLDEGLITRDEFEAWTGQYENYVPLKGWADEVDPDDHPRRGTGQGFAVRGKESMPAMGRRSRAGQIVENILLDRERALIRTEKNRVGKALLDLVTANPDERLWRVDPVKQQPRMVRDAETGERQVMYEARSDTGDHVFVTKLNGREVRIALYDPLFAAAMKNLTDAQVGPVLRFMSQFNGMLSRLYTGLNPTFVVVNGLRDALTGMIQAQKYDPRLSAKIIRHYRGALAAAARFEYGKVKHHGDEKALSEWDRWFAEYSRNGGRTGFMALKSLEDKVGDVQRMFRRFDPNAKAHARAWARIMTGVEAIEGINQSIENAIRLAAYRAARELGMSPAEAVSVAKNITVNFNRRGELTRWIAPFFLFYNAAVQGSNTLVKAMGNPRVQGAVAALTAGAAALALFNVWAGGDDDDDGIAYWDKIPSYVKERNLIIMLPPGDYALEGVEKAGKNGRYLKFPMPYGFNVFTTAAAAVVDGARNLKDPAAGRPPMRAAGNVVTAALSSYNPLGGESPLTSVAPILQPALQAYFNVNRFGEALYPTPQFGRKEARAEQFWESQRGTAAQATADLLNRVSGGNTVRDGLLSIQPAVIDNTMQYFTGGAGQFVRDSIQPLFEMADRGDVTWSRLPFAKQVYGTVGTAETRRMVNNLRNEAVTAAQEFRALAEQGALKDFETVEQETLIAIGEANQQMSKALSGLRRLELSVRDDASLTGEQRRKELNQIEVDRRNIYAVLLRMWTEGVRKPETINR